ncbi:hypothetical protein [Desulfosporosinus hippei]|uniref:Uncharacterized protein n=1 Tax=Desulfosporosinus hippei DSM 8344 TaxID=1121419 RepID=A0A1G7VJQ2_9FIRM|nr:hypothetical protein [Desulfosporosinus hippei]SDG59170.1 hypothetical protein SAMN05443529_104125 [Desulfosporosinus hippei DSM 8344]
MKRRALSMVLPLDILIVPKPLLGKYTFEINGVCDLCAKKEMK